MTDQEYERMRAQTAFAVQQGERWRQELAAEFAGLTDGTVVMINVVNGRYVTAASRIEAMNKFDQLFGKGTTLGFSFEVGRLVFIGGGIG
jgi:hypothetical protein